MKSSSSASSKNSFKLSIKLSPMSNRNGKKLFSIFNNRRLLDRLPKLACNIQPLSQIHEDSFHSLNPCSKSPQGLFFPLSHYTYTPPKKFHQQYMCNKMSIFSIFLLSPCRTIAFAKSIFL